MDKVILAENVVLDGGMGSARPNDNQVFVGASGSGKSLSGLIPTLLHMKKSSLIGTFAKKSIVANAVAFLEKRKYRTIV